MEARSRIIKSRNKSSMSIAYEPKEGELCIQFYNRVKLLQAYNQLCNIKVIHIANEQMTSKAYTIKLLRMGMLPGVADYLVAIRGGRCAFIEFKRNEKCKQSVSQKKFQKDMEGIGFDYHLVCSVDKAIELLEQYNKT